MGRPTDNPKPYQIFVKYDEKCKQVLEEYCRQEGVTRMEAIRRGIRMVEEKLEKEERSGSTPTE